MDAASNTAEVATASSPQIPPDWHKKLKPKWVGPSANGKLEDPLPPSLRVVSSQPAPHHS